jgi:hypothetical protein
MGIHCEAARRYSLRTYKCDARAYADDLEHSRSPQLGAPLAMQVPALEPEKLI